MSTRNDIFDKLAEGILALDGDFNYAEPSISKVFRYWPRIDQLPQEQMPCVVIDDNGNVPGPVHDGLARFISLVNISAIVSGEDGDDLVDRMELMSEALTKYLHSDPDLHDNILDIMIVEREDIGIFSRLNRNLAEVMLAVRILWWDRVKAASTDTGTWDVWHQGGNQWLDDAGDKLYARITGLKTNMEPDGSNTYLPLFSYTYPRHAIPDLTLNAVSMAFQSMEQEEFGGASSGNGWTYTMTFSVRVHTAYADQSVDDQEVARLMNSIINKLRARTDLTGGYWLREIGDVDTAAVFPESESQGGEFTVTIVTHVRHVQE
jgi:hypothetical protein